MKPAMRSSFLLCFLFWAVCLSAQDTAQHVVAGRTNALSQQDKPYVVLISVDGLRADLVDKYKAANLHRLRSGGVQARYMNPSFPSLTFPNHYTLVTGLRPAHHGLVGNKFWDAARGMYSMSDKDAVTDSAWYGGMPLWVLAEKQGMLTASFYWVGSESAIQEVRPTYFYSYNDKIPMDRRIEAVRDWLALSPEKRPHLITFYFPEVDHAEHDNGPDSDEAGKAVQFVDESIGKLVKAVEPLALPVSFVLVSDHGMAAIDNGHAIPLPAAVDTTRFVVAAAEAEINLYARDPSVIEPTYAALRKEAKGYAVYLKANVPERWHYGEKDDRYHRIGDIVLVTAPPAFFHLGSRPSKNKASHGFDPFLPPMHASFYAWGPAFKKNRVLPPFDNVHVYPLIAHLLGLTYDAKAIDGRLQVLKAVLAK